MHGPVNGMTVQAQRDADEFDSVLAIRIGAFEVVGERASRFVNLVVPEKQPDGEVADDAELFEFGVRPP